MIKERKYWFVLFFVLLSYVSFSQTIRDSAGNRIEGSVVQNKKIDSVMQTHSPKKAAIRSAILPGWGQAYNKKYWKIPIVYGALGTAGGFFIYNVKWYNRTRFAYKVLSTKDTSNYDKIFYKLQGYVRNNDPAGLQYYRNEFRRDVDYSVIAFILLWGLNVVDASVDAHLKTFDVTPDLSLKIKPGFNALEGTTGISIVFLFK
ncbi:MAG: DUF5683 domain-containing protein [Chitinophagaceae bacterium]